MKLTVILLVVTMLQVSASSMAQKVSLQGKDVSLNRIFKEIRKQTGYNVLWNSKNLNATETLNVNFDNSSLNDVLTACLDGKDLEFTIEDKTILIMPAEKQTFLGNLIKSFAAINVSGTVVDENGNPLGGATVKLKGTTRAVIADKDGKFSFDNVDKDAILIITYISYQPLEIPVGKISGPIKLTPLTSQLNDVVVTTAYGIERNNKELGYSTAKVSGEELNKANNGTVLNGLIGKVSGLNIAAENTSMSPQMKVLIRGIRSFGENSNNQPLFIFNGAPLSFGSDGNSGQNAVDFINNLNPADIGEVTVLKGANGTAMYGPEGVNGVIIITTKKTKVGVTTVNAQVNNSYQQVDFRNRGEQRTFGLGNDVSFFGGKATSSWGPAYDGRKIAIGYPDANGNYQTVPYVNNYDNHEFFNVARTTRTNASVAQADLNSSFYLGVGRLDQTGLLPGDIQNQNTVFYNSKKNIGKILELQLNLNYSQTNSDRGYDVTSDVLTTPSFIPLLSYKDYQNSYWGSFDNYWSGINPYAKLALSRTKNTDNVFTGSVIVNLKIAPWLTVKDQVGWNYLGRTTKTNITPVTFSSFARVDPLKHNDIQPQTTDYLGSANGINNDLLISAVKQKGDFMFRANIGGTIRQNDEKQLKTNATLVIPVYNDIFSRSDYGISADEVTRLTRSLSAFGNFDIGYKDRIFLEVTGRNDWDSKRAAIARGQDFYFGANTSILLKEMIPVLKQQTWLSTFRLRASVAHTANLNIEPNQAEKILTLQFPYPYTSSTGTSVLGYFLLTNPNPLIKPEKILSQEYGTEMGFLNNRIRFDASYYKQVNNGVIMQVAVPPLSGYPDYDNAGKLQNTGWEFDLNLSPLVKFSDDINISLQGRLSINNNKVLQVSDIYNGTFIARDPSGQAYYAKVGQSAFQFGVIDFMRDPQGRVIVDATTGIPTPDFQNPKIIGKTLPTYQGGATLNVNYKRFTFSTQADYSAGNDHLFPTTNISNGTSSFTLLNNRQVFVFPNSVIQTSPGVYVPNTSVAVSDAGQNLFQTFANASINGLSSASFWKIRQVALEYAMPVKTSWIKKITGSIYARDLFSFYPKSNLFGDPIGANGPGLRTNIIQATGRAAPSQTNNVAGNTSDQNTLPGTVVYGFNLNLSF